MDRQTIRRTVGRDMLSMCPAVKTGDTKRRTDGRFSTCRGVRAEISYLSMYYIGR